MTPSGRKLSTILLLSSFLLSLGRSLEIDEKRQIHSDPYSLDYILHESSSIATRADGSLVILGCNLLFVGDTAECAIHVVGLSGPVITYPIRHEGTLRSVPKVPEKNIVPFLKFLKRTSFDMIENVAYLLFIQPTGDSWDHDYVTMLAVDLTSGTVSKFNLPSDSTYLNGRASLSEYISLIVDHNGANLILKDPSVCGDLMPRCKFTFNKRGERLGGPFSFPIESGHATISFPRTMESADKGVLVFQDNLYEVNSIYIDTNGNTTVLHRFKNLPTRFFDTGDLYLACKYTHNLKLNLMDCVQYDWKQNKTVQLRLTPSNFSIEGDQQLIASVASLDKSTFLVAYFKCREDGQPGCSALVSSMTLDGKVLKTTRLFDDLYAKPHNAHQPAIVEVENQFCFYIFYNAESNVEDFEINYDLLNVHTKCIPRSDL
ncbi:hypothetical protein QAD02_001080 [Eretmocerus hayati]|uniref:Uncharacterized protein n=1 Tax=Eretmocerus hayati TaxID=131215 RepID=A0ACC2NGP3_9HYME|nr:hypothetical protein QAD02_001080 [Eretmocerus hayati]